MAKKHTPKPGFWWSMCHPHPHRNQHCVYYHYGDDRELLYVGCTYDFPTRQAYHQGHTRWWNLVRLIEWEVFTTIQQAYARERDRIIALHPLYNKQYNTEDAAR